MVEPNRLTEIRFYGMSSPEAPESSGVQLQPIATPVETIFSSSPVAELLTEISSSVIICLQLRPALQCLHDPRQTISVYSMIKFPSSWSISRVLFSTRKGHRVSVWLPRSSTSVEMETVGKSCETELTFLSDSCTSWMLLSLRRTGFNNGTAKQQESKTQTIGQKVMLKDFMIAV